MEGGGDHAEMPSRGQLEQASKDEDGVRQSFPSSKAVGRLEEAS